MSVTQHPAPTERRGDERRRELDRDLVAVLGTVAILVLTAICLLGSTGLPR